VAELVDGTPELMKQLKSFETVCAGDAFLKDAGLAVVITEIRRRDYDQALDYCSGRTVDEIAADLDHHQADQNTRALIGIAIQEVFGAGALPEDRAPGRIVTNAFPYSGPHCLGVAAHFRVKRGRRVLPDDQTPWEHVGALAKKCGFVWGGTWKMRDMEHIELPKALWPQPEQPQAA
jgi:hypothetical protein